MGRLVATGNWLLATLFAAVLVEASIHEAALAQGKTGYQLDTELIGEDRQTFLLSSPGRKNPATCARACEAERDCQAWTYVRPGGLPEALDMSDAICRLKAEVTDARSNACCISGYKGDVQAEADDGPTVDEKPPSLPESVQRTPDVISVGKWPEGIAWDGLSIWVAESGRRRITRLDPDSGEVLQRVRVGRLPVGMTSTSEGSVYAAVATDKIIWRQPADDSRGGVFAQLRNYPQAIASDDDAVWVLTWVGGSSSQTQVVRMDLDTGRISRSAILPRNGFDLAVTQDTVWILHRYDGEGECALIGLDKRSLEEVSRTAFPGFTSFLAANDDGVFAAGAGFEENGLVVKFDLATGQEVARHGSDVIIAGIAADEQYVITADMAGEIQIHSADALSPLRGISLTNGPFRPQKLLPVNDRLFITTHQGDGANGSLLVVEDWRP